MKSTTTARSETLSHLREYLRNRPTYKLLCDVAKRKIREMLEHRGIPFASITERVKSFPSMMVRLKGEAVKPGNLMKSLNDTAGSRIIVWQERDRSAVAECVNEIFDVLPGTKEASLTTSVTTYKDDKYYCNLRTAPDIPRKLEGLTFELQVQTAMENVWATLSHDIYYKASPDLPNDYRKRFDLLLGLANLADHHTGYLVRDVEELGRKLSLERLNVIGLKAHLDKVTQEVDRQKIVVNDFRDPADARVLVEDLEKCGIVKSEHLESLVNRDTVNRCIISANGKHLDYSELVRLILMMEKIDLYFDKVAPDIVPLDKWQLPILKSLKIDYQKAATSANKPIYISDGKNIRLLRNRVTVRT